MTIKGIVTDLEKSLKKISENPWLAIEKAMSDASLNIYVKYRGNNSGIYIYVTDLYREYFQVKKAIKFSSTSEKYIALFRFLKKYVSGSNEEISNVLGYKHASQTSLFLKKTEFVKKGKAANSKWTLK